MSYAAFRAAPPQLRRVGVPRGCPNIRRRTDGNRTSLRKTGAACGRLARGKGPAPAPQQKVVLDQRNLAFVPFVLAVRVGTTVEFPNNDKVFHNVFSFRDGKKFDLGMYPTGSMKPIVFDQPGLARLFCNIHPNMAAYVMAVDSPYFAVSNEKGAFTLSGVPPGTYNYHAWRPGGQPLTGSINVDGNTPLEISWP